MNPKHQAREKRLVASMGRSETRAYLHAKGLAAGVERRHQAGVKPHTVDPVGEVVITNNGLKMDWWVFGQASHRELCHFLGLAPAAQNKPNTKSRRRKRR